MATNAVNFSDQVHYDMRHNAAKEFKSANITNIQDTGINFIPF